MRIARNLVLPVIAALLAAGAATAQQQPQPKPAPAATQKAAGDKENVSTPGPTGGSCSATSTDNNKTCSISCKTGQSAICTNTQTTVSCRCS